MLVHRSRHLDQGEERALWIVDGAPREDGVTTRPAGDVSAEDRAKPRLTSMNRTCLAVLTIGGSRGPPSSQRSAVRRILCHANRWKTRHLSPQSATGYVERSLLAVVASRIARGSRPAGSIHCASRAAWTSAPLSVSALRRTSAADPRRMPTGSRGVGGQSSARSLQPIVSTASSAVIGPWSVPMSRLASAMRVAIIRRRSPGSFEVARHECHISVTRTARSRHPDRRQALWLHVG